MQSRRSYRLLQLQANHSTPNHMKILEGAVHQQLYRFLSENKLITPDLFGFCPKLSTVMPLLILQTTYYSRI